MERLLETGDIVILPRAAARKTGDEDPVDYYYRPISAGFYRARLRLAASLLGSGTFETLLEVGYGSGIFLPELARRTRRLAGLEVHDEAETVAAALRRFGIEADLRRGSVYRMPFDDGVFDAVVCLSVLEHLTELDGALGELRRVLRPGGIAVLSFPVRNAFTDGLFRLVGYDPRALHPSSHTDILAAARRHPGFTVEREGRLPSLLPRTVSAYACCRCRAG